MLHNKFQGNRPSDSGEDFLKSFTIYEFFQLIDFYPQAFLKKKKAKGILLSPPSLHLFVMLSPPKQLDEIQPNLVRCVS